MKNSLEVTLGDRLIFTSNQRWLYPLFELEDFLKKDYTDTSKLFLKDKIGGRAAACLIAHLGIKHCHIELLSKRAVPVLERHHISFTYDTMVEQIQCRTETMIYDEMSIDDAYLFLRKRVGRVNGLTLRMDSVSLEIEGRLILNKVDLLVERGEQLVIHGSNGAGKTTLLRAILGFIPTTGGKIEIGNIVVGSRIWYKQRNSVAYINQEWAKNWLPITAGEVVKIGLGITHLSAAERGYRVELAMRRTGSFHLYDQPYNTLSSGEKQRVSIARCLCQNAGVFLLDEPTSYLDTAGKANLLELLTEISRNEAPTMIVVSHEHHWAEKLNWTSKELKGGRLC